MSKRIRIVIAGLLPLACATVPALPLVVRSQTPPARIVVDHTSVTLFDSIPAQYIIAARNLRMIFLDKSVGENISVGLTCLTGAGVASCGITGNQPYSRDNWVYQWFDTTGCGAWNELETCFETQTGATVSQYDVLMYGFSYMEVDQPGAVDFFNDTSAGYEIGDAVAFLQSRSRPVVLWTSSLNRGADADAEAWNELMRGYAISNGYPLFDLADILSHRPNGQPCLSLAGNYPAICYPDYTTQTTSGGGHLSKAGQVYVAKALWVLMAQLTGWVPGGASPTPTPTPIPPTVSPLPTPTPTAQETAQPTPTPTGAPPTPTATRTVTPSPVPPTPSPTPPMFEPGCPLTKLEALLEWDILNDWLADEKHAYSFTVQHDGQLYTVTKQDVMDAITNLNLCMWVLK